VNPADANAAAHVFVADLAAQCTIRGDDGHHLQRVRRLRNGERVTAADGTGAWRTYTVVSASVGAITLEACGDVQQVREPLVTIALAVALTKAGLDAVVSSVTELGVARITPVLTERSIARWSSAKAARVATVAREAAMQSRRARVPIVDDACGLDAVLARNNVVVADRTGCPAFDLSPPPRGEWTVVVGPEGGLNAAELARASDRPRLAVGNHVLRATTAPIAAVAVMVERIAQMTPS